MSNIVRYPLESYKLEIINGEIILTPKECFVTEDEINRTTLISSEILKCVVKNGEEIISDETGYQPILNRIWESMSTQKILQTTTFNMKLTNENGLNGYKWNSKLNLSIQGKNANKCMKEILNMIKVNNYSINITIRLETEKIIKFKLNN